MDAMEIETISAQHFNDVPVGNAHFSAIEVMNETEIMTGKSEGQFAPYDTLNRAEAAIIIQRAMQKIELLNIKKLMK